MTVALPANPALAGVDPWLQAVRLVGRLEGQGPEWVRLLP